MSRPPALRAAGGLAARVPDEYLSMEPSSVEAFVLRVPDHQGAVADLVRRYGRLVRSVVEKIGGVRTAAERDDIEQRVMLALWEQVRRGQEIRAPASYLYRCAVRETVRALRATSARPTVPIDGSAHGAESAEPDRALRRQELAARLDDCMERLRTERKLAVRAHLAGFEVKEIMALHDWPYNKARNLISRGMADLRTYLREAGVDAV